ncbi:hypothetical protein BN946_scf184612.g3 [Trametes cinnabarina]|uniref:Uncharacterized protein n=1 Tax=Pycnoporus cinnabarinus TaxID=5643 RepID=A0A060SUS0_PYCCI|nr:hypothetical protein BN946_scf184612.g3 [Trametes cinnabarina]
MLQPTFSPASVPSGSISVPGSEYVQLALRVERLEQENVHLRDLLAKMPMSGPQGTPAQVSPSLSSPTDPVADFLKHIHTEESLLPGEQPGEDCVAYWQAHTWAAVKRARKGKTAVGDVIGQRGKTRIAKGENVSHPYLEDVNGKPIDGHQLKRMGEFTRAFIWCLKQTGRFPQSWKEVDVAAREVWFTAVRKKFPVFQICEFNWKAEHWMGKHYYDAKRKCNSPSGDKDNGGVTLDSAPYTMESTPCPNNLDTACVNGDVPFSAVPSGSGSTSASSALTLKQPPTPTDTSTMCPLPQKRPRLSINMNVPQQLDSEAAVLVPTSRLPSPPDLPAFHPVPGPSLYKGKERAHNTSFRISDSLVHATQPAEPSTINVPPPVSPLGESISGTITTVATTPLSTDGDQTTRDAAPAASTSSAEKAEDVPTVAELSPNVKACKKTATALSSKPWPPPDSETQPKWIYARMWLKEHPEGSRSAFEHHYTKELSTSEKRAPSW